MAGANEATPRRKRQPKPPPTDPEAERKRLLLKVERMAMKKTVKLLASGVEFDFVDGESRRALEMAEDARALLEGKPLPVRPAPSKADE